MLVFSLNEEEPDIFWEIMGKNYQDQKHLSFHFTVGHELHCTLSPQLLTILHIFIEIKQNITTSFVCSKISKNLPFEDRYKHKISFSNFFKSSLNPWYILPLWGSHRAQLVSSNKRRNPFGKSCTLDHGPSFKWKFFWIVTGKCIFPLIFRSVFYTFVMVLKVTIAWSRW